MPAEPIRPATTAPTAFRGCQVDGRRNVGFPWYARKPNDRQHDAMRSLSSFFVPTASQLLTLSPELTLCRR